MAKKSFRFSELPTEMRLAIFDCARPDDWCYRYKVGTLSGPVRGSSKLSPLPSLFAASKWTLVEAMDPVRQGVSVCRIQIDGNIIKTNWPLVNMLEKSPKTDLVEDKEIRLPPCQTLSLTVWPPSHKSAEDFIQTRRSVAKVVNWLNACDQETLPCIQVKIGADATAQEVKCKRNDFAMLMGPLLKLRTPCTSPVVPRGPGYASSDSKIEQHSDLLQRALNTGSEHDLKELTYQQSILDVRLQMWYIRSNLLGPGEEPSRTDSLRSRIPQNSIAELHTGIQRLQAWCETSDAHKPLWLAEILNMTQSQGLSRREAKYLFDKVVGEESARFERWAAGQLPAFDPLSIY